MTTEKKDLTLDEQMKLTLNLVANTLYNTGFCAKLRTYQHHAERLRTENAETSKQEWLDALDLFLDFMKRSIKKSPNMEDLVYVQGEIRSALKAA